MRVCVCLCVCVCVCVCVCACVCMCVCVLHISTKPLKHILNYGVARVDVQRERQRERTRASACESHFRIPLIDVAFITS